MAVDINSPTSESLFAEIVAICFNCASSVISFEYPSKNSTTLLVAWSIPLFTSTAFDPFFNLSIPSDRIDWANNVDVVVPSPAWSAVLIAACFTICAPKFSKLSSNVIDLATVTPSFVDIGLPISCSIITLRPEGPNVDVTASANLSTPVAKASLASPENVMFLLINLKIRLC